MDGRMLLIVMLFALIFSGCAQVGEMPVACTAEAKICPDGTGVGRVGPDCEFAPCPDGGEGVEEESLFGHEWKLLKIDTEAVGENPVYIQFNMEDGTFSGNAGCNHMGGGYTLDGDRIEFGQTAVTLMYCEQHMDLERKVLEKMGGGPYRWEISGQELKFYEGSQPVMAWEIEE
ncbi:MAG: META domain-containing protein [bacterium]|nr:META domain-containing protein [bacterium]